MENNQTYPTRVTSETGHKAATSYFLAASLVRNGSRPSVTGRGREKDEYVSYWDDTT